MATDLARLAVLVAALWLVCHVVHGRPTPQAVRRWTLQLRELARRSEPEHPLVRPIETIASNARRLGHRFHHPGVGASFVKSEGVRWAYDKVLGESCAALGVEHLLEVLPPGEERDAERERVERLLRRWGFEVDDAA